jgi:N6-adenosine-specific RNA methylase IME4
VAEPFRVIVADPPWRFSDNLPGDTRGASKQYACMTTAEICRLGDTHLGDLTIMDQPIARDAALLLWRVASMPQDALDVVRAWGFTPKTELIWLKKTSTGKRWFGMGRTLRAEHETCIVATRGRPSVLNHSTRSTFVTDLDVAGLSATVGRHSEKPDAFTEIVESLFDGPRLELFARRQRAGWTCLGLEAGAACTSS